MSSPGFARFSTAVHWSAIALTGMLGMQVLRTTFAQLVYLLRDRIGWSAPSLGLLAIAIFLTAFLAALVRRLLTPGRALLVTAAGLGLARLAIQAWPGEPLVDFFLGLIGTVCFTLFLPIAWGHARAASGGGRFTLGLLLGLALDVALHGAYGTWDAAWRHDAGTLVLVIALVAAQSAAAWRAARLPQEQPSDSPWWPALAWAALGPFLFLEMLLFQNLAALNAQTGWGLPAGLAWTLFCHVAGLAAAAGVLQLRRRLHWPVAFVCVIALFLAGVQPPTRHPLAGVTMLLGQVAAAAALAILLRGLEARGQGTGLGRTTVAHGIGMLLMTLVVFVYYAAMDIRLPLDVAWLPLGAEVLLGLCALGASLPWREEAPVVPQRWLPVGVAALLLVVPLAMLLAWPPPQTVPGEGFPVRVMDYNLHGGFDCASDLDLEAIARTIEAENPDIVGLQEVSRGWVINGSADMLLWLSHRLNMPYLYGPTVGPLWGNAILSRYPVFSVEEHELPPETLLMGRGFLVVQVDLGNGQTLQVIDTHFHHVVRDQQVRLEQSQALLAYWNGAERTVITGDFNAKPDEAEVVMLREAGLQEACALVGISPCWTDRADHLVKKIDYLWLSPDLRATDVVVPESTASDHLPVVATVGR